MSKEVNWNKFVYERFCELAMLSDFEKRLLKDRIEEKTRTWMCREYSVSMSTLDRAINKLKKKYDVAQAIEGSGLPKRRNSKEEEYMDSH